MSKESRQRQISASVQFDKESPSHDFLVLPPLLNLQFFNFVSASALYANP